MIGIRRLCGRRESEKDSYGAARQQGNHTERSPANTHNRCGDDPGNLATPRNSYPLNVDRLLVRATGYILRMRHFIPAWPASPARPAPSSNRLPPLRDELQLYVNHKAVRELKVRVFDDNHGTVNELVYFVCGIQYGAANSDSRLGVSRHVAHVHGHELSYHSVEGPVGHPDETIRRWGSMLSVTTTLDQASGPAVKLISKTSSSPTTTVVLLAVLTGGRLCCRGCSWAGVAQALELRKQSGEH